MKLTVISFGKMREDYLKRAEEEYIKRIRKFSKIEILELDREERDLSNRCDYIIALDEHGEEMESIRFAEIIRDAKIEGINICFIVGKWRGLTEDMKERASKILSLSKMTFPYQVARVILLEQIYRAFTIIEGIKYHK